MLRLLFGFLPWWIFAFLAVTLVPLAVGSYDTFRAQDAQRQTASVVGPPPLTEVGAFNPRRNAGPLDEVRLVGTLRADIGILSITFGETDYNFVTLDGTDDGPLIALIAPAAQAEQMVTRLVNSADAAGRVEVQGFLTPSRIGNISRLLATRGDSTKQLFVVEPYFGGRDAALSEQIQEARTVFYITAGFTAFFAAMAAWRFRRWRKRRAARRPRPAPTTPEPAQNTVVQMGGSSRSGGSPWDSFQPQDSNLAPTPAARRATPQPAKPAPDPDPIPTVPEFESVFPGGGSGFRFKSADEIIRQSFGTLSTLNKVNRNDD